MSDYVQITSFGPKDSLASGNPSKLAKGVEIDAELAAIIVAITSKFDADDVATLAEAQAETLDTKVITPLQLGNWSEANAGILNDLQALAAPGQDRILGYDQTTTSAIAYTLGTGIETSGTALQLDVSAAETALSHDNLTGFVADEHVAHASVSMTTAANSGLTGGGTIAATRTLSVDINGTTTHSGITAASDFVLLWDTSAGALRKATIDDAFAAVGGTVPDSRNLTAGSGLTGGGTLAADRTFNVGAGTGISVAADSISTDDSAIVHDNLSGFVANEHIDHSSVTLTAGTGLTGGGTIAANRTFNAVVATTSAQGIGEIATQAEVDAGTDTTRWVTPETLAAATSISAGAPDLFIVKTSDQSRASSASAATDSELTGTVDGTAYYEIEAYLHFDAANGTMGMQVVIGGTSMSGSHFAYMQVDETTTSGGVAVLGDAANQLGVSATTDLDGSGNEAGVLIKGFGFYTSGGANSRTISVQWAQDTSNASNLTLKRGSYLKVTKIADI